MVGTEGQGSNFRAMDCRDSFVDFSGLPRCFPAFRPRIGSTTSLADVLPTWYPLLLISHPLLSIYLTCLFNMKKLLSAASQLHQNLFNFVFPLCSKPHDDRRTETSEATHD